MKHLAICALASFLLLGCASQRVNHNQLQNADEERVLDACEGIENCVVAAVSCDDNPDAEVCNVEPDYGGIAQEYVVKGCKVTVYNDGPIKMVDEKTDEPCNAPIPENHDFGGEKKVYTKDGCTITEYTHKSGLSTGTMDCS